MKKTRHHVYFPRTWYKTSLERRFRNHPYNIVWLTERAHNMLHHHQSPPRKPSPEEMEAFLKGG